MGKQLKFTEKEQKRLPELIKEIGIILLSKIDEGVDRPEIEGTMDVPEKNSKVVFNIYALQMAEKFPKVSKPVCPLCNGTGRRVFPNCTPPIDEQCPACKGKGLNKQS